MFINFKDKMYIYHPDGKFTEKQLIALLEAARKMGYDEGYETIPVNWIGSLQSLHQDNLQRSDAQQNRRGYSPHC